MHRALIVVGQFCFIQQAVAIAIPTMSQVSVDVHPCVGLTVGRKATQHGVGRPDAAYALLEDVVNRVALAG